MNIERDLLFYIKESKIAITSLNRKLKGKISSMDFQLALASVLEYEEGDSVKIIMHRLTAKKMLEKLEGYEFNFPEEIAIILFENSIFI